MDVKRQHGAAVYNIYIYCGTNIHAASLLIFHHTMLEKEESIQGSCTLSNWR